MDEATKEIAAEQPRVEWKRTLAEPAVMYTCPHCGIRAAVPGARAIAAVGGGGVLRIKCGKCNGAVEVWAGEQPRIAQPEQLINREMRRAHASQQKRIVVP